MHVCMFLSMYVHVCIYVGVCIRMFVCECSMYVCTCLEQAEIMFLTTQPEIVCSQTNVGWYCNIGTGG